MRALPCLLLLLGGCLAPSEPVETGFESRLVLMSFNVWGAGSNEGKAIDETVAVIEAVGPDILGMQETRKESEACSAENCAASGPGTAAGIAEALGYYYYEQTAQNDALWANAILSRYPIVRATPNQLGVSIDIDGRMVMAFNVHFADFPYQPYQILGIDYGAAPYLKTEAEVIDAAAAARGSAMDLLLAELDSTASPDAVFVFGDFNEPSHRDWTGRAVSAGLHPMAVRFPATSALEAAGFIDTYRSAHPDEIDRPGHTWTARGDPWDPNDHHDRIDYIFARGASLRVLGASVAGENSPPADIVITRWPSDHRAVVAVVGF